MAQFKRDKSKHLSVLIAVNTQEKKLQYYLLCYQGLYYFAEGFLMLFFQNSGSTIQPLYTCLYNNLLTNGLLIGIGISLYLGRRVKANSISISSLGSISALLMLVYQISIAFSFSSDFWQSLDLIVQLLFLVLWGYLIYWQWIEGEFTEMNRKKRDSSK